MNNIPSITKNLLIINVLAFFATWVFEKQGLDLTATFGLHFFMAKDFSFYQLVTYLFMHGSFMHLFFNMFAVWMFGTVMERVWGPKRFLIYYLVCGIGAGIIQEGVQYINYANENLAAYDFVMTSSGRITTEAYLNLWTTVGASGAVYAIPQRENVYHSIPIPHQGKMAHRGIYRDRSVVGIEYSGRRNSTHGTSWWYALRISAHTLLAETSEH